jgi:hypothetical protein
VRAGDGRTRRHLRTAFASLFALYGDSYAFDVTVTANLVLRGNAGPAPRYHLYYGQDFTAGVREDLTLGTGERDEDGRPVPAPAQVVYNLGDVEDLRTEFDLGDFRSAFETRFETSDVSVGEIVNTVFIIRRFLPGFNPAHASLRPTRLF